MKRLYRSRTNKKVAGICGGLGDYFQIDPVFVRLLVIVIAIFTGIFLMVIAYIIAAIVIPQEPKSREKKKYKRLYRSRKNRVIAGVLGGFAEFLKIDSTVVRIVYVLIMVLTAFFPMIIAYIFAWIIIPEKPTTHDIEIEVKKN
ncbi:MAG: hypothetical protein K940chlam1_00140 [Candidatus Anoxychlamydiales bacterium]|nr:hypothetical protein [Candidatus Anoxychlamydiales bacterium]NGX35208.1 hypothetical protein [Candidatus Anoxychlamydiales bacterium]